MATTHPSELHQHGSTRTRLGRVLVTGVAAATLSIGVLPGTASADTAPAPVATAAVAASPTAQAAVNAATAQVGAPYAYGGTGPAYDCSGLTSSAYAAAGVALPRTSSAQSQVGTPVSRADLVPGDLVFFYSPVSHVGIYVGDGLMVNALNSDTGVLVSSVDMPGYAGASRVA